MKFLRQILMNLRDGVLQAWRAMSLSARVNVALAGVATAIVILYVAINSSQQQYVRLYGRLDPADSANVQTYLRETKQIEYKVEDDGRTILVPLGQRERVDLKTAMLQEGIPRNQGVAPGFELFEQQDIMTNRWLIDMKYMRAIQGELQKQLNEFSFVENSFVMIREAKEELFVSEQKPSEAAVTLDVTRSLSKSDIKVVLALISSFGGANLTPDNVLLTTTDGTELHVPPTSKFASIANDRLEYTAEIEQQRERRATEDLARLGAKAIVKVSAILDFDSKKTTDRKVTEGTALSEFTDTLSTNSTEALPQGAPGVNANLPPGMETPKGTEMTEENEQAISNYEPSFTETETVTDPGNVDKFIVAAIIEGESKPRLDDEGKPELDDAGNPVKEYVGLTDEKKLIYENYLRAAVGEGKQPTEITVSDMAFGIGQLASPIGELAAAGRRQIMVQYGRDAIKMLLLLIAFVMVRRFLKRATMVEVEEEEEEEEVVAIPKASAEDIRRQEVAAEVERLAREEPEVVASLLRSWLAEDEEY